MFDIVLKVRMTKLCIRVFVRRLRKTNVVGITEIAIFRCNFSIFIPPLLLLNKSPKTILEIP